MLLEWNLFFHKFQIWRPLTALFYYPLTPSSGFHWLLMLYFLYNYSRGIETGLFDGRPADYLSMLIFNWIICTIICLAAGVLFLLEPMVLSVLYVWCQMNRDQIVQFWFGTQFKAMYLPWILDFGGRAFLRTPQILYNWFPSRTNVVHGFGQAPSYRTDIEKSTIYFIRKAKCFISKLFQLDRQTFYRRNRPYFYVFKSKLNVRVRDITNDPRGKLDIEI
ncbi:Derlin-1 [Dirofilaria immitis]